MISSRRNISPPVRWTQEKRLETLKKRSISARDSSGEDDLQIKQVLHLRLQRYVTAKVSL
jgi:hypothetical protein